MKMKKRLGFFALLTALVLPLSISAKTITADTTLTEDVNDGILVETGNVTLDLGGKNITNEAGKDTIKVEKGATLTIVGKGNVTNTSDGKAVIANDGTIIVKDGTYSRVNTSSNNYYVILNHGNITINGGKFTGEGGTASLFDNGWYDPSKNTEKTIANMDINGGVFEISGNDKYIKNDDYGVMTVNNGTFSMVKPSSAVIGQMGFASGKEKLTVNGGTFNYTGTNYAIWDYDWNTVAAYKGQDNSVTVINGGIFNLAANAKVTNVEMKESVKEYTAINGEIVVAKEEDLKDIIEVTDIKEENISDFELDLINKVVENKYVVAGFYNIDLFEGLNNELKISQLSESDSAITVTLKIPSTIKAVQDGYKRTYYVVRVHVKEGENLNDTLNEDVKVDLLDATLNEDGTVSFKTDKFSTYSLVYVDTKEETKTEVKNPNTSDNAGLYFVLALVGLGFAGVTVRSLVKHN